METIYLGIVIFLFMLAVFDLLVGVSNDAVNFMNSAVGAKVAKFKTIIIVASAGVLIGAMMSNGMMDIARHGIFQPGHFSFYEIMCILLAVMVTDVVLLDVFNTMGLPTSTTVSLVFELLGGTFIIALLKIFYDSTDTLSIGTLLNTEKALSVILGIFLSVAAAFIVGTVIQYISRLIFTFNYKKKLGWTIGLFGGISTTSLAYFILIKGIEKAPFMKPEQVEWMNAHTIELIIISFVVFTAISQLLYWCKVNVFKVIILLGTFALALAFAGNDLVNFIGVPLAGYSAYTDFIANGSGTDIYHFMMSSLESSAKTPFLFLFGAGLIMVFALATSKKAKNVIKTSVDLSRQEEGEEMFGSSRMARLIVRNSTQAAEWIHRYTPPRISRWIDSRFNKNEMILENGAAFDLVRASVNLVLSGLLIILGTSMKLPLSTTYVTFIVAMGTSLSDRAWGRESAVYRITGVISVIGGWFITAFVAFAVGGLIALCMYYGGVAAMFFFIILAIGLLIRSHIAYNKKQKEETKDSLFKQICFNKNKNVIWTLLRRHVAENQVLSLEKTKEEYNEIIEGISNNNLRHLRRAQRHIAKHKDLLRMIRQREMVGMRRIETATAIEYNTWFHLGINSCTQMMYSLRRIVDPCHEHVDNNFTPMPNAYVIELQPIHQQIIWFIEQVQKIIEDRDFDKTEMIADEIENYKIVLSALRKKHQDRIQHIPSNNMKIALVYLNLLQESQELLSSLRHLIRAYQKFQN